MQSTAANFKIKPNKNVPKVLSYRAFHGLGQAKFPDGGSVLGTIQFSILPQLPPKILLDSKMIKIDQKIIISPRQSKSTHSIKLCNCRKKTLTGLLYF